MVVPTLWSRFSSRLRCCGRLLALSVGCLFFACKPDPPPPVTADAPPVALAADAHLGSLLDVHAGASVLIISFDALRADALGVYGYDRPITPRLDRFAGQSVVFDRAYTTAPVTPTSFAAAFTAQLPFRVFRAWNLESAPTMAEAFKAAGYTTIGVFNNVQLTSERHFDRGFDHYTFFQARTDDQLAFEKALEKFAEFQEEKLFAWIHFNSPHSPYDYRTISQPFYNHDYRGPLEKGSTASFSYEDPVEIAQLRSLYDGEIYFIDDLFGQLIDALEEMGLLDRAFTVITTDHGEEFGERGFFQHRHMTEETVRVPLFIRPPGGRSGVRIDQLFSNVDLWPTLAAATGLSGDAGRDGWNLLAPPRPDRPIVSVAMTDPEYRGISIRQNQTKLILTCMPEKHVEVFDLALDPGETKNLAEQDRSWRPLLETLRGIVGGDPCQVIEDALRGVEQTEGLRSETIEGLRALGYLQ